MVATPGPLSGSSPPTAAMPTSTSVGRPGQGRRVGGGFGQGAGAGGRGAVGVAHGEGQGAADLVVAAQPGAQLLGEREQRAPVPGRVQLVAGEGAFGGERAGGGVRDDRRAVDCRAPSRAARARPSRRGGAGAVAERRGGDPADGVEAVLAQGAGGRARRPRRARRRACGRGSPPPVLGAPTQVTPGPASRAAIRASIGPGPAPITQSTPYRARARTRITAASSTASRPK